MCCGELPLILYHCGAVKILSRLFRPAPPPPPAPQAAQPLAQTLRQDLGEARRIDQRDWDALRTEWFGMAAAPPEQHDALEQRFLRCLRQRTRG
jgi:hypothetical protein